MPENLTDLPSVLKDPTLFTEKAFVAGAWISADDGGTFTVSNPARGDVIARVADLSRTEVARAIASAHAAQKEWAARTGKERARILRDWADLMVANADDLAAILTAEMGKPLAEARGEILYGASYIEWFGEEAKRVYGETIPGHQRDKRITVLKQPIGVAASITPWNFPNAMIARKVAPALAAGCGFVARPAAETPLSALAMAILAERAGVFAGVVEISVADESAQTLLDALRALDETLTVTALSGVGASAADRQVSSLVISLVANDRPGIVRDVSAVLAAHELSIDDLSTEVRDAAMAGGRIFEASVLAHTVAGTDLSRVKEDLEKLAAELQVEIAIG